MTDRIMHYSSADAAAAATPIVIMASDEEIDPLIPGSRQPPPLQNLLFPRRKTQVFMPLTAPSGRNSRRCSYTLTPEYSRQRTQVLLERQNMPAHSWERYRKSADELKTIKKRKVREFYEDQVWPLRVQL
jgi:hypothetical protein